ncbi:MAG: ANTAR domain-containing protein, partial [Oscillospiraceae bacterium]|nr:ANTAR domain-containing protein [Oscillospiraceae bacterium]
MVFQSDTYSVLLVSASEKFNTATLPLLPPTDYWPVTLAGSVGEARRRLVDSSFDLILVNTPLPDDIGVDFSAEACAESDAGVLLLIKSELYEETYYRVLPSGVITLSKPTTVQMISQNLRVLCAMRERLRSMRRRQATVEEKIEEIRLINRAKWLLIESLHMTEPDAHRYITR